MRIQSMKKNYKSKKSNDIMLITVDHGNNQIKAAHRIFDSDFTKSDAKPPFISRKSSLKPVLKPGDNQLCFSKQALRYLHKLGILLPTGCAASEPPKRH